LLRATTSQKCAAVPRRARIEGSKTCVSLNSRLESNKEEEEECTQKRRDAEIQLRVATKEPPGIVMVLAYGIAKEAIGA